MLILWLAACATPGDILHDDSRQLLSADLGDAEVRVVKHMVGRSGGTRLTGGRVVHASEAYQLSYEILLEPELVQAGPMVRDEQVFVRTRGEVWLESSQHDVCVGPDVVALRVPRFGWEVLWRVGDIVVSEPVAESPCPEPGSAVEWMERASGACDVLSRAGLEAQAAACELRGGGRVGGPMGPGFDGAVRDALLTSDEVFAVAPSARHGASLSAADVGSLLARCTELDCPAGRVAAMGAAARAVGDASLCDRVAEHTDYSDADGLLAGLVSVRDCASDAVLSPRFSRALVMPTGVEWHHRLRNYSNYAGAVGSCAAADLSRSESWSTCASLPRLAGTWLAGHCSADVVLAASEAAALHTGDLDPRVDMVLDGALRVLGACDEAAFEVAIAAASDEAPTPDVAEARGKPNLRALFLTAGR
jgi:hypothetical protein